MPSLSLSATKKGPRPNALRVLFHRAYHRFHGGHLKVWHYFCHVKATAGYDANIFFTPDSVWDATNPWLAMRRETRDSYDYQDADILFLAGQDWRALPEVVRRKPPLPVINLLQGVRHAHRETSLYDYLAYPAIRVVVSEAVRDALSATGRVNGPIVCIPNGLPLQELPPQVPWRLRDVDVVVCALKDPPMGRAVADRLRHEGYRVRLLQERIPREQYLSYVSEAKVAVLIPKSAEGFYLPALEAMAMEVLAVCPDCIGNRSFCRPGETAEMPPLETNALVEAARRLLVMDDGSRKHRQNLGSEISRTHSLDREREAFQAILRQVPALWRVFAERTTAI